MYPFATPFIRYYISFIIFNLINPAHKTNVSKILNHTFCMKNQLGQQKNFE